MCKNGGERETYSKTAWTKPSLRMSIMKCIRGCIIARAIDVSSLRWSYISSIFGGLWFRPPTWPSPATFIVLRPPRLCTVSLHCFPTPRALHTLEWISMIISLNLILSLMIQCCLVIFPDVPEFFLHLYHIGSISLWGSNTWEGQLKQWWQYSNDCRCLLDIRIKDMSQLPIQKLCKSLSCSNLKRY